MDFRRVSITRKNQGRFLSPCTLCKQESYYCESKGVVVMPAAFFKISVWTLFLFSGKINLEVLNSALKLDHNTIEINSLLICFDLRRMTIFWKYDLSVLEIKADTFPFIQFRSNRTLSNTYRIIHYGFKSWLGLPKEPHDQPSQQLLLMNIPSPGIILRSRSDLVPLILETSNASRRFPTQIL